MDGGRTTTHHTSSSSEVGMDNDQSQRVQQLSFHIPLSGSGRAGFGISVRCRIVSDDRASLFVKTVVPGGAAAKVLVIRKSFQSQTILMNFCCFEVGVNRMVGS